MSAATLTGKRSVSGAVVLGLRSLLGRSEGLAVAGEVSPSVTSQCCGAGAAWPGGCSPLPSGSAEAVRSGSFPRLRPGNGSRRVGCPVSALPAGLPWHLVWGGWLALGRGDNLPWQYSVKLWMWHSFLGYRFFTQL